MATTKGTGGDIIILEEAAYIDPGFFYETVAPLLIMGDTSLLAISTLCSEVNFYTRFVPFGRACRVPPGAVDRACREASWAGVAPCAAGGWRPGTDRVWPGVGRLLRMRDKLTNTPFFTSLSVQLACQACIADGKATECVHMLHLVPRYASLPSRLVDGMVGGM